MTVSYPSVDSLCPLGDFDISTGRIRAVLFDFVGTLTPAVHRIGRRRAQAAVAHTLGCDPAAYQEALDASFFQRATGSYGQLTDTLRAVAHRAGADPTPTQVSAAARLRIDAERRGRRLRPEAVPVLRELRDRAIGTAVVSDCTHELPADWPLLPVARYVAAPVFSIEVGVCKPDPLIYKTAYSALGVAPEECLYIGDGGSQELSGARQLGMTAVQLVTPDLAYHHAPKAETGWDGLKVGSLTEVLDLVG